MSEAQPIRFANPGLLVETEWLAAHLDDTDVRIVDTRDAEAYQAGHVPGAVNIPRAATFDPEELGSIVGRPDHIAALFGAGGIDETAHVIVHDEGRSTAAPRVFWTLEYYGHPNVSVLDGGFTKWEAEGRDVRTETPDITPVTFTVEPRPDRLSTKQSLLADLGREDVAMVDARSPEEHRGESVRSARGGHYSPEPSTSTGGRTSPKERCRSSSHQPS